MAIDFNDPEVAAAISEQAQSLLDKQVQEGVYVPASEIEGLKNKNKELLDWKVTNKDKIITDFDENELTEMRRIKAAKDNDEFVNLVLSGKTEEAKAIATGGIQSAWKEKNDELNSQFTLAQKKIDEQNSLLEQSQSKIMDMTKRTYLRELTGSDESFKADHFEDFFALNSTKMQIDPESGAVYATDAGGKVVMDTEGNKVPFSDYYSRQKVNGLFWKEGSGSGARGVNGEGDYNGADPRKWSPAEQTQFITENGRAAYAKAVSDAVAAARK